MVDSSKPGGVRGLAAMFEANVSMVKEEGPVRKPAKKLNNPFEANASSAATTAPKPAPVAAPRKSNLGDNFLGFNSGAPATEDKPLPKPRTSKLMTSMFEQNI